MTDAIPAAHACNSIQHISLPAVTDRDAGDWLRRISPEQTTATTNFLPGTRRSKRKGVFPGEENPAGSAGNELRS
jgi:hypothetical protein